MKFFFTVLLTAAGISCLAQGIPFKSLRYDENYTSLANDTSSNWYKSLKFAPLTVDKLSYVSFGGEIRYQYFHYKNEDWGEAPNDRDGFVLTRYLAHADLHLGSHFRTFLQLQSSLANGQLDTPSPVDQNIIDLHQAFADYALLTGHKKSLTLRFGRQEFSYGSQRLVSVREAPNNRQAFDALRLIYVAPNARFDVFNSYYVPAKPNIFDDGFNKNTQFWGGYAVFNKVPLLQNTDIYYLGLRKKTTVFDASTGLETRHSVGARAWGSNPEWLYDVETIYQFGNFAGNTISAWTASANVAYTFSQLKHKPQFGIKTEVISGDRTSNDGRLNTFNPLFPRGGYFGLAALIGPSNLTDIHPYAQIELTKAVAFNIDYDLFFRMSRNDGIYAVNGRMIYPGKAGTSDQIGRQLGAEFEFTPNKHFYLRQEITWFSAGEFLKQAGPGKDILMVGTTATFKF
ncbi:alginate export family protein [Mucilaginibacter auburnensis]|uniref:Alginate export protein n=1 Tax=Mucilaginibacter auburnensis TaxID=1457233 RepID=A0A2H9VW45_9SPHI|nr:alginate export family protein [Mucilaginibacter auburnensis]PJJ85031.1 alginate export protein [Mucilaginibacter auburnensis]